MLLAAMCFHFTTHSPLPDLWCRAIVTQLWPQQLDWSAIPPIIAEFAHAYARPLGQNPISMLYTWLSCIGPVTCGMRVRPHDNPSQTEPMYSFVCITAPSGSGKVCVTRSKVQRVAFCLRTAYYCIVDLGRGWYQALKHAIFLFRQM